MRRMERTKMIKIAIFALILLAVPATAANLTKVERGYENIGAIKSGTYSHWKG